MEGLDFPKRFLLHLANLVLAKVGFGQSWSPPVTRIHVGKIKVWNRVWARPRLKRIANTQDPDVVVWHDLDIHRVTRSEDFGQPSYGLSGPSFEELVCKKHVLTGSIS